MKNMLYGLQFFLLSVFLLQGGKSDIKYLQWRGPQRNGIYSEAGLFKSWPSGGPSLIWSFQGLGSGHGNIGPGKDKIFVLGMTGSTGFLYAFDYKGNLAWKKEYGAEWNASYVGARSTPVVIGNLVYFESGMGTVYCFDAETGGKIWSVDLLKKFNAENVTWGMAESLLIDGDYLYCTPGGKENNIVALNRFTGATIWTSPGNRQPSAYCSPLLVKHNQTSLIVTMTARSIIGVDALTGQFYWQVPQFQGNKIHANTPVYYQGRIYCSSDYDETNSGLVALKLSEDGKRVSVEWRNESFRNLIGGIIISDNHIYGSMYRKGTWSCLRTSDGQTLYSSDKLGDGSIIMDEGLFYCYSEKGEVALVNANPVSFNVISRFKVPLGTDQHWAHPVIYQGRLYIRHGDALMVYDIKAK
ncbi:MAG: PQQ-binding-like beta-propeller repeat protein [Bacteroidales bacterium]|nr:PQQ-binding-like beta-propeller repeat protein [Bacteroidales bacterium]